MSQLEKKVDALESLSKDLAFSLMRMQQSIEEGNEELRQSYKELRQSNKELKENLERSNKELKENLERSEETMEKMFKRMDKKWGDLANKMGTIVEDLIFPSFLIVIEENLGLRDPDDLMIRRRKHIKRLGLKKEFDMIVVYSSEGLVFLNETKSSATNEYIDGFIKFVESGDFFVFFPEYKELRLVPVFSSLNLSEVHIQRLTAGGILAMHIEGSLLSFKNSDVVRKRYGI